MSVQTAVINSTADHEETVQRYAKHLGKDKIRRQLFDAVYGYSKTPRSLKQIMKDAGIAPKCQQQAQNQIDHLAKHKLIAWQDNDGSVKDGARKLYFKEPNVRALRNEIKKYADRPDLAKKLATKRGPQVTIIQSVRSVTKTTLRKRRHLNVLYLTADPIKSHALRVDAEVRRVQDAIRASKFRDSITVEFRPAANLKTLLNGLNDVCPEIVHFSGHGNKSGIAMDNGAVGQRADEMVTFDLFAKALSAVDSKPKVVVLNACNSSAARKQLLGLGLIVISMQTIISDNAAAAFAPRFYAAIASGQSVKSAFAQAKVAVESVSIGEADTPELFYPNPVDPGKIILC